MTQTRIVPAWIGREEKAGGRVLEKRDPHTGDVLCRTACAGPAEVDEAVRAARAAAAAWAATTPVKRGEILLDVALALKAKRLEMARVVAAETGKSPASALAETDAAVSCGVFFAGEGQRFYGRTLTSAIPGRRAYTVREPLGVAGLIVPANTPVANVAWKVFPALVCGNTAVLKAAEDAPATAWTFGRIAAEAGLPPGILSVVHGDAAAGAALAAHPGIDVVSFTGSSEAGRDVAAAAARRLARASLELGGKNPFVVCDDADLGAAVHWAALSAFSNAGQRCASASRIVVFDAVYDAFRVAFVEMIEKMRVGPADGDDFGPVVSERHLARILEAVEAASRRGARVLTGGRRLSDAAHAAGYYMAPTLLEGVAPDDELSTTELFGPVTALYRARDFEEAVDLANRSPYGLTAAIHTRSTDRALVFADRVQAGVVCVNAGTFGSEPHMPFGGLKRSGNGTREPGTEALDVYSSLKNVYLQADPKKT